MFLLPLLTLLSGCSAAPLEMIEKLTLGSPEVLIFDGKPASDIRIQGLPSQLMSSLSRKTLMGQQVGTIIRILPWVGLSQNGWKNTSEPSPT